MFIFIDSDLSSKYIKRWDIFWVQKWRNSEFPKSAEGNPWRAHPVQAAPGTNQSGDSYA